MTLDELLAREEIHDVLKRYVRGVDRRDRALLRSCYHDDATDDHGTFVGSADDFVVYVTGDRALRWASTTHFIASPNIVQRGDKADVDTYCIAHHVAPPDGGVQKFMVMALRYLDRFERRDGVWLISHRRCVYDWTNTHYVDDVASFAMPEGCVQGSRSRADPWYAPTDF